uniref:Uncharacterized protein n=1 Tax=Glossina palpalis gambiensis TaxID=67801 RepID=A0A1B0AU11_9MUSC
MKNFSSKLDEKICEIYFFLPARGITSGFVLSDALVINLHTRLTYSKSYPRRHSTLFLHSDTKVSDGGSEAKIYEGKKNSVEHNTKTWKIFIRRATSFKYFFHCCTSLLIDKKSAKMPFPKAKNDNMMKSSTLTLVMVEARQKFTKVFQHFIIGKKNNVERNTKTWKIFIRRATSFKYFFHCCTSLLIDKKSAKMPFPKAKNDNMMKSSTLTFDFHYNTVPIITA